MVCLSTVCTTETSFGKLGVHYLKVNLKGDAMNTDEHATMIEDCENRESKLSDWERQFISSIADQLDSGNTLSVKQQECLDAIWERIT